MAPLPRILTVDSTSTLSRIIRAALDLMGRSATLVDVPTGEEAIDEIKRGGYRMVVTALELSGKMKGFELSLLVKQSSPSTSIVILADIEDPENLDEETMANSPFAYLHRPVDIDQFARVMAAGLEGEDVVAAMTPPVGPAAVVPQLGPVPHLDLEGARAIMDVLLKDVAAMAIILINREGEVLLERGAPGYINRDQLTHALMPMVTTSIEMGTLIGGKASTLQYYDGDNYDVFVLFVGLHHFLCVIFDGQTGNRQFGGVRSFGRRAVEDLLVMIPGAFEINKPKVVSEEAKANRKPKKATPEPVEEPVAPVAVRAEIKTSEPVPLQLEPIANLDFSIFDNLSNLDTAAANDLFNPDKLAEIANESRRSGGPISYEEAKELGIVP